VSGRGLRAFYSFKGAFEALLKLNKNLKMTFENGRQNAKMTFENGHRPISMVTFPKVSDFKGHLTQWRAWLSFDYVIALRSFSRQNYAAFFAP
jgi:hypothetical protein